MKMNRAEKKIGLGRTRLRNTERENVCTERTKYLMERKNYRGKELNKKLFRRINDEIDVRGMENQRTRR